jgi:hypothetical protein
MLFVQIHQKVYLKYGDYSHCNPFAKPATAAHPTIALVGATDI